MDQVEELKIWQGMVSGSHAVQNQQIGSSPPRGPTCRKVPETLSLYYAEVLDYLRTVGGNCTDCKYSEREEFGGHIVKEFLPYQERSAETARIVGLLEARRAEWVSDRECNPLLAIPGSGGTGKSTFLAHFGASQQFVEKQPGTIVSTLTFNKQMFPRNVADENIGLRVLYGALRGMQCLRNDPVTGDPVTWTTFCDDLVELEKSTPISVIDAVWLLRALHGQRRVLILVDELVQLARQEANEIYNRIFTQLGGAMDNDEATQVIVSAIAPQWVAALMSSSRRRISYTVLPPLIGDLGAAETKTWVGSLPLTGHINSNRFKMNLLYSTHLLTSGFPRALQRLRGAMQDDAFPRTTVANWFNNSVESLLMKLAEAVSTATDYGGDLDDTSLELLLSSKPICVAGTKDSKRCRKLLEYNCVFIHSIEGRDIKIATFLFSFLQTSLFAGENKNVSDIFPIVGAGQVLFRGITLISQYFERAIDLSIFSRGIYNQSPEHMFEIDGLDDILFLKKIGVCCNQTLLPEHTSVEERFAAFGPLKPNSVNIPPNRNPGFDSAWRLESQAHEEFVFYVQAKISDKPPRSLASTVAEAVKLIMQYHSSFHPDIPLARVYVLFCLWEDVQAVPTQEELLKLERLVFVEQHHANIVIRDRAQLSHFLIPTLVQIPTLVNAVLCG